MLPTLSQDAKGIGANPGNPTVRDSYARNAESALESLVSSWTSAALVSWVNGEVHYIAAHAALRECVLTRERIDYDAATLSSPC